MESAAPLFSLGVFALGSVATIYDDVVVVS